MKKITLNKCSSLILLMSILVSMFLVNINLVSATEYKIDKPSFPFDFPSDIDNNGVVNSADIAGFANAYIKYYSDGTVDLRADLRDYGKIDSADLAAFVNGYIKFFANYYPSGYGISNHPIAYSDYFSFHVPQRSASNVWDYVIIRFYVPAELVNKPFWMAANHSSPSGGPYAIRKIQVDTNIIQSGENNNGQPQVYLGQLGTGYHLLLFELRELSNGDQWFRLGIGEIQTNQSAQLDRFRIQIPDYTDSAMYYNIVTIHNIHYRPTLLPKR